MSASDASSEFRILWIAYVFPPVGGTQGVRMKRYLEEIMRSHSHAAVDVLTIHQSRSNPQYDADLERGLPAGVRINRVRPGLFHKLRYRWNLDRRLQASHGKMTRSALAAGIKLSNISWIARAACWLMRRPRPPYDAVYVFVDPFGSLSLGWLAHQLNPVSRLVLEYGDPRSPTWKASPVLAEAAARLEERALSHSSAVIFRTHAAVAAYRGRYKSLDPGQFSVLYGGVDWAAYDAIDADAPDRFTICYTGTIYADSVDPEPFFQAVARMATRREDAIRVLMVGAESPAVLRLVRDLGLASVVSFAGHIPMKEIAGQQRSAQLLLAFGVNCPYKISSKLAQYFAARVPVLYVSESADDPGAALILRSRRGLCVPNTVDAIEATIQACLRGWQHGDLADSFDLSRTGEYSWEHVAGGVMSLLMDSRRIVS